MPCPDCQFAHIFPQPVGGKFTRTFLTVCYFMGWQSQFCWVPCKCLLGPLIIRGTTGTSLSGVHESSSSPSSITQRQRERSNWCVYMCVTAPSAACTGTHHVMFNNFQFFLSHHEDKAGCCSFHCTDGFWKKVLQVKAEATALHKSHLSSVFIKPNTVNSLDETTGREIMYTYTHTHSQHTRVQSGQTNSDPLTVMSV